ncbi:MAG TPA: lipoprotein insertase outer membrane protein LolB [Casimicrobiaceae bacterium]
MIAGRIARPIAIAAALAGCAPLAPAPESVAVDPVALAAPFTADGRLSARRGNDGVAGQFSWQHQSAHDRIDLTSPLGQTIARLEGDPAGVKIEKSDGRVEVAKDWDTLTARSLGLTLPVGGLSAWLRGLPRDGSRYTLEHDERNRPSVLRQDGWEVTYAYAEPDATRAARVTLRYPGADPVEVRIVVDRWQ